MSCACDVGLAVVNRVCPLDTCWPAVTSTEAMCPARAGDIATVEVGDTVPESVKSEIAVPDTAEAAWTALIPCLPP